MSLSALDPAYTTGSAGSALSSKNDAGSEDRFLKLLVAQMQNQDPLNPMDNAQVTSQMAQIQTVNGIAKLDRTVASLGTQFSSLQALQGASLVGRDVTVPGNTLATSGGIGVGGFELGGPADAVKVEILSPGGAVIDTIRLGAEGSGRHGFEWQVPPTIGADAQLRFRVSAASGAAAVPVTELMRDHVEAVSAEGEQLTVELSRNGALPWRDIRAFN
jgi:flagellar basal-body rod modification protein FlgD